MESFEGVTTTIDDGSNTQIEKGIDKNSDDGISRS